MMSTLFSHCVLWEIFHLCLLFLCTYLFPLLPIKIFLYLRLWTIWLWCAVLLLSVSCVWGSLTFLNLWFLSNLEIFQLLFRYFFFPFSVGNFTQRLPEIDPQLTSAPFRFFKNPFLFYVKLLLSLSSLMLCLMCCYPMCFLFQMFLFLEIWVFLYFSCHYIVNLFFSFWAYSVTIFSS